MRQEYILWLLVAMNVIVALQQDETAKNLLGKAADELERESTELMRLDQLVKIHV